MCANLNIEYRTASQDYMINQIYTTMSNSFSLDVIKMYYNDKIIYGNVRNKLKKG